MMPTGPLPRRGSIFFDTRGDKRALRVTWHPEAELVVLSLWRDNLCAGTFRLPAEEVPALVSALTAGLPDGALDGALDEDEPGAARQAAG